MELEFTIYRQGTVVNLSVSFFNSDIKFQETREKIWEHNVVQRKVKFSFLPSLIHA